MKNRSGRPVYFRKGLADRTTPVETGLEGRSTCQPHWFLWSQFVACPFTYLSDILLADGAAVSILPVRAESRIAAGLSDALGANAPPPRMVFGADSVRILRVSIDMFVVR